MKGTAPPGARDEREAAAWVRGMFARVARRYDLANHLLSFPVSSVQSHHQLPHQVSLQKGRGSVDSSPDPN